jgi:hypothetical protein
MTNTNRSHTRSVWRTTGHAATAAMLMLPLGLMLSYHAARAQTQAAAPSCAAALDTLMSEWRSIGFAEPGKPSQMVVPGRHGYTTTGGQFNFMRQQIRAGATDCEAGREVEALRHIETVRGILARSGPA